MKKILNVLLVIAIIFSAVWSAPLAHAFEADDWDGGEFSEVGDEMMADEGDDEDDASEALEVILPTLMDEEVEGEAEATEDLALSDVLELDALDEIESDFDFEADDEETPIRPEAEWMMVAPRHTTSTFPNTQVHVAPSADPADFNRFPAPDNHIWATNPVLVTDFEHSNYLNWDAPAPIERMSYRISWGPGINSEVTLHEGEADTIDFFNVPRPEGFYVIHFNGHHDGSQNMDAGYVFVNIQRTSSFVNIDGVSITQDSSLCLTVEGTIDPDTGELVRCDSAALPAPVINPSVITVGRPAHDVHGEYTVTWTIVDEEDGELVAEGTGTAPIDVHTHPGLRDRLALDRIYTITVTVTETTPDGFPHDAGIVSQSIGRFEIVPTYVYVFHIDEAGEPLQTPNQQPLSGIIGEEGIPVITNDPSDGAFHEGMRLSRGQAGRDTYEAFPFNPVDIAPFYVFDRVATSVDDLPEGFTIDNDGFITNVESGHHADVNLNLVYIYRRVPRLSLEKTVNEALADVGDTLTYTLTVTNHSPFSIYGAQVIDDLSELFSSYITAFDEADVRVTSESAFEITLEAGALTVVFDELVAGEIATIEFDVVVLLAASGATLVNSAILESRDGDTLDEDDAEVRVPELSIEKLVNGADLAKASVGETLIYTLTVENHSDFSVFGARVIDDLSEFFGRYITEFDAADVVVMRTDGYTVTLEDGQLIVVFDELAAHEIVTITFETTVLLQAIHATFTNTVRLENRNGYQLDEDDAEVRVPALIIEKQVNGANSAQVSVGDTLTYTLTVTNVSLFRAFDFRVVDDLSRLFDHYIAEFDAATITVTSDYEYTLTFENGHLVVAFSELAAGDHVTIEFDAVVLQEASGSTFVNTASLENRNGDQLDEDDAEVRVSEVAIEKQVNGADSVVASVGDTLTYTIVVTNHSDFSVFNHQMVDDLSALFGAYIAEFDEAAVQVISEHAATVTLSDGRLSVSFSELTAYEVATIEFDVVVLLEASGATFKNVAILENDNGDELDEDEAEVRVPEVAIEKWVNGADSIVASVGDTLTYTIVVTNHSDFSVMNYQVVDDLSTLVGHYLSEFDVEDVVITSESDAVVTFEAGRLVVVFHELVAYEVATIAFEVVVLVEAAGSTFVNIAVLENDNGYELDEDDAEVRVPILSIEKLVNGLDSVIASVGDTLTYTITVENHGASAVHYQVVDDLSELIGAYITEFSVENVMITSAHDAIVTLENGILTVFFSELEAGERITIEFETVVLEAALGAAFINVAILEDADGEEVHYDDAIVEVPHLSIEKRVNGEDAVVANVGDTLTYTIHVTNHSAFYVVDYRVIDDLSELLHTGFMTVDPETIAVASTHDAIITFEQGVLTVVFDTLAAAEVATLTFEATVLEAAAGETLINVATLENTDGTEVDDDYATVVVEEPETPISEDEVAPTPPVRQLPQTGVSALELSGLAGFLLLTLGVRLANQKKKQALKR